MVEEVPAEEVAEKEVDLALGKVNHGESAVDQAAESTEAGKEAGRPAEAIDEFSPKLLRKGMKSGKRKDL